MVRYAIANAPYTPSRLLRGTRWQYSSFHRLVREGIYPPDWGADDKIIQYNSKDFGE